MATETHMALPSYTAPRLLDTRGRFSRNRSGAPLWLQSLEPRAPIGAFMPQWTDECGVKPSWAT
jgi:hypothetical protein